MTEQSQPRAFRFSEFTFYPETEELWRGRFRIRINRQTTEVLRALLDRAGRVVTREEFRQLLWPDQHAFDHEKAINNCVSRLRQALRDDPEKPKVIARIPRRGYRLLVPVEIVPANTEFSVAAVGPTLSGLPVKTPFEPTAPPTAPPTSEMPAAIQPVTDLQRPLPSRHPLWNIRKSAFWLTATVLCILAPLAILWQRNRAGRSAMPEQVISLGLAPLQTQGDDTEQLAEGFRAELIDALCRLPDVHLHAVHSLGKQTDTEAGVIQQASNLGLDMILIGRFTHEGNQFQLNFQLVRAKDAAYLASFRYNGTREQLFSIRDQIQRDLYHQFHLSGGQIQPAPGGTRDPVAYDAFLHGSYDLSRLTEDDLRRAVAEFSLAIAHDPTFARAYTGLARTYMVMRTHGLVSNQEAFDKIGINAAAALRIAPDMADVHGLLGYTLFFHDWKFSAGEQEVRRAIQLDPSEATFHQWLAVMLNDEGRYTEAFHELDYAMSNDPYWPPLFLTDIFVSGNARNNQRMLRSAQQLEQLTGNASVSLDATANSLWYSGRYEDAIATWHKMASVEGDVPRVRLEEKGLEAFRKDGVKGYAILRLKAIQDTSLKKLHPNDFQATEWYIWIGDTEPALANLTALAQSHDPEFLDIVDSPVFDKLKHDPRYLLLLQQSRLTLVDVPSSAATQ